MAPGLSAAQMVWISIKPIIKITLPGLVGAALLRHKKLDDHGLKAAALIQIFGALPCLVFANIVPSITIENSPSIGICIGFGLFYMLISYVLAKLLLVFVTVPDNFKHGFLVAAVWSNWGNLPISVIQSLAVEPPFGKPLDDVRGVAYCSFFVMIHNLTMFAGPGTTMIERDFLVKDGASSVIHEEESMTCSSPDRDIVGVSEPLLGNLVGKSYLGTQVDNKIKKFFSHLVSPVNVALLIGTVVAIVPALKGLFVGTGAFPGGSIAAPDGKPLLSVLLNSTEYLGASAIPLSLLVTGASFAKINVPRSAWSSLPLGGIFGLMVIKLVILPIVGISAVATMDKYTGVFRGEETRILKMICLYYSCTVTSTNQISLSAIAAGDHDSGSNVDLLCAFIIFQYFIYPFVGTIVIGIGIKMVM